MAVLSRDQDQEQELVSALSTRAVNHPASFLYSSFRDPATCQRTDRA